MDCLLRQGKKAYLLKGGLKEFAECYQNAGSTSPRASAECFQNITSTRCNSNTAIERINLLAEYEKDIAHNTPPSSCPLDTCITEVLPNLYLGNAMDAANEPLLESSNIRYILNLTKSCPNYFLTNNNYRYKQIKIEDSCREDIKSICEDAIAFIDEAKANNSAVLIHCQGGVSRSPTVTIAYLMHLNHVSLKEAYEFVKTRRPCIAPNLNFMGQLLEMEQARTRTK
jgi:dual specificity MAP kinase phosphatase